MSSTALPTCLYRNPASAVLNRLTSGCASSARLSRRCQRMGSALYIGARCACAWRMNCAEVAFTSALFGSLARPTANACSCGAMRWAQQGLQRDFGIDIETCVACVACVACGRTIRVIACIEDPVVIKAILAHPVDKARPAQRPPQHPTSPSSIWSTPTVSP